MFPRKARAFRQEFASPLGQGETGFAATRGIGHGGQVARGSDPISSACRDCYPFPSPWPGPLRVGPFFCAGGPPRRQVADGSGTRFFGFAFAPDSLESSPITKTNRGSLSCGKPSSSSLLPPCRWPAVCKTPRRAVLPGPLRAPLSPMRPTTTRLPARSLAALRGQPPAACPPRNAVRQATPATDLTTASAGSEPFHQGSTGQAARLALFHFAVRPGRHEGRAPCSRKS